MAAQLSVAEMRQKIANGEIKRNSGVGAGPGAGTFGVQLDSAEFAQGENGNLRGKLVCRVILAQDASNIGKKFNYFLQTVNSTYAEQSIAEFSEYCAIWGIPEDRIYDRAEDMTDVIGNICTEIQRLAIKGKLLATIERKDSGKVNAKGKPMYWNDIREVSLNGAPAPVEPVAAPVAAPVAPAPAPVAPAPVAPAPVAPAPAPAASGKPWRK